MGIIPLLEIGGRNWNKFLLFIKWVSNHHSFSGGLGLILGMILLLDTYHIYCNGYDGVHVDIWDFIVYAASSLSEVFSLY